MPAPEQMRANEHDGVEVLAECLERIEEHPPRDDVQLIHAMSPRARSSRR